MFAYLMGDGRDADEWLEFASEASQEADEQDEVEPQF